MGKNPENTRSPESRLNENDQALIHRLKDCDELKHNIASRLVDLGVNTSVNKTWPSILSSLRTWLMDRFEANRDYCERSHIRLPKKEEGFCELFLACGQLHDHLKLLARGGDLGTESIVSPFRAFVALANYWRNRMQRGFENRDAVQKGYYEILSSESRQKVEDRFEEVMGLRYELIEPLLQRSI
jgi:hypothetical protein